MSLARKASTACDESGNPGAKTSPASTQNGSANFDRARTTPPAVSSAPPKSRPSLEYEIRISAVRELARSLAAVSALRLSRSVSTAPPSTVLANRAPNRATTCSPSHATFMTRFLDPALASASISHCINGVPSTSSNGLGQVSVSGRIRSPRPAARISASAKDATARTSLGGRT